MQFDFAQPLYTGGRLRNHVRDSGGRVRRGAPHARSRAAAAHAAGRRDVLPGAAAGTGHGRRASRASIWRSSSWTWRRRGSRRDRPRASTCCARKWISPTRRQRSSAPGRSRTSPTRRCGRCSRCRRKRRSTLQGTLEQIERLPAQAELLSTLDRRPDLRAIGAQRSQAEHAVALADGEWKPSFALTGNLQYQQDARERARSWTPTNRSYAVGFAMRIPLFAAPGAMARKATAEAQVRQARNGLDAAIDNGRLEVDLGVHRVGGRAGAGRRAAEGARPGAREPVDRPGVLRERR